MESAKDIIAKDIIFYLHANDECLHANDECFDDSWVEIKTIQKPKQAEFLEPFSEDWRVRKYSKRWSIITWQGPLSPSLQVTTVIHVII